MPFLQNKDRWFDRPEFFAEMRQRMAELTNQELERAGYTRRVFAGKMKKNGIHKEDGEKLGAFNNQLEFEGIPTLIGTKNERKQWKYVEAEIERAYQDDLTSIEAERSRLLANDDGSPRKLTTDQWKALGYWKTKREQEALARRAYRWGEQIAERLSSRPSAMFDIHINHLNAAYQPGAKPSLKQERAWRENMVTKIHEHLEATRMLFAEELQLAVRARELVRERADEARNILKAAGLVTDPVFEVDPAVGGGMCAEAEPVNARRGNADGAIGERPGSTSSHELPQPTPTPTPIAAPAPTPAPTSRQMQTPSENSARTSANGAERHAAEPASAASKPAAGRPEPARGPHTPLPETVSAADTGAAQRTLGQAGAS